MYTRNIFWAVCLIVVSYDKWGIDSTKIASSLPLDITISSIQKEILKKIPLHKELVLNYTQGIKDDFARFIISTFLIHCPDISLCYDDGGFYKNYSIYTGMQYLPCQPCSCANDCERKHDCCIFRYISQRNLTSNEGNQIRSQPEKNKTPLSCKRTQIGAFNIESKPLPLVTHWIITQCPQRFGSIIWRKCRKLLSTDELRNEKLHRPVTSSKTNESYQNEYCAKCFGEKRDDLFQWKRVLFEKQEHKLNMSGDPFQRAYDGKSMISYEPPTFLKNNLHCTLPKITKCNVTGDWDRYDERLLWACEKIPFTVLYATIFTGMYKNMFCALCNNSTFYFGRFSSFYYTSILERTLQLGVFADLLRFSKPMEVREYRIESRCPKEEIFSPILKQCLPVVCAFGYLQQGPKCQSISYRLSKVQLEVYAAICIKESDDTVLFHKMRTRDISLSHVIRRHLIDRMYMHNIDLQFYIYYMIMPSLNEICCPLCMIFFHWINRNKIVTTNFYFTFLKNISFNNEFALRFTQFKTLGTYHSFYSRLWYIEGVRRPAEIMEMKLLTDQNHCPRIYLPNSYHINFTVVEACIAEYDVCFESQLVTSDDKGICLCLDVYKQIISEYVRKVNNEISPETYLSIVSLSVSSFCCLLTLTRYLIINDTFSIPLKLKMVLSVSLFLANTLYTSSSFFTYHYPFCMVFGILSHYLWLMVVGVMSTLSFDLFISIFGSFKLKWSGNFFAYIISNLTLCMIVVTIHILLSFQASEGSSLGYSKKTCLIENGKLKFFTLVLPIILMVVLNTVFLMAMIYCIRKWMITSKSREKIILKVILKISSVTGVAWIFGFLYELTDELFFAHAHNVFSGCIGVFIFLSF